MRKPILSLVVVAETAEILRRSEFAGRRGLGDVAALADRGDLVLPGGADVRDFLDMLHQLHRLRD